MNSVSDLLFTDILLQRTNHAFFFEVKMCCYARSDWLKAVKTFFSSTSHLVMKVCTDDYIRVHKISLKRGIITVFSIEGLEYTTRCSSACQIINSLRPTAFIISHVKWANAPAVNNR